MGYDVEFIEVDLVKAETPKAILVDVDGEDYWVPKSQINDDSEVYSEGDSGTMIVSHWWVTKAGLA